MDEKNKQTLTLDDIVNQLTKPSVIQSQDSGRQIPAPSPSPVLSPSPQLSNKPTIPGGEFKLPTLGGETKNSIQGIPPIPLDSKKPGISLTIRTMAQDIEGLKSGQKPASLGVGRIAQIPQPQRSTPQAMKDIPEGPKQIPPILTLPRIPVPSRPSASPPLKLPNLSLPHSFPQPPPPLPPIAKLSEPKEYVQDHYHKEEIVSESDDDMLPAYPGALVPKKIVKPIEESLEYRVLARIIGSGMTAGIIVTVIIAIAAYILLSVFVFNAEEPLPSLSLTPTPQATRDPEINELGAIFRDVASVNFSLPANQVETTGNLKAFIEGTEIGKKQFLKINFILLDNQAINATFTDILDRLSVRYPATLKDAINVGDMTFMYGQAEVLGEPASLPDPGLANKKIVIIVEVKDVAKATEIMLAWEPTMAEDLKSLFNIEPSKAATSEFIRNEHRGVAIRYKNFPLPDRSIDYAIIHSLTGRQYLVITNSRESMYSPVEKVTGL